MIYLLCLIIFLLYIIGQSSVLRAVKEQPVEAKRLRKESGDTRHAPHHYQRLAAGLATTVLAIVLAMLVQAYSTAPKLSIILPLSFVLSFVISLTFTWRNKKETTSDKIINIPTSLAAKLGPVNLLAKALSKRKLLDPRHIDTTDELLARLETQIKNDKGTISEDEYQRIRTLLKGDARTILSVAHELAKLPSVKLSQPLTPKIIDDASQSTYSSTCLVKDASGEIIGTCSSRLLAALLMSGSPLDDRYVEQIMTLSESETITEARKLLAADQRGFALTTSLKGKPTGFITAQDLLR
jgi:CBS domain containing-hemolysin-like protein